MVIYEVNIAVNKDIQGEYLLWIREHIEEMLKMSAFISADLLEVVEPMDDHFNISVQYIAKSREDLNHYLEHFADKMRQSGVNKFEGEFTATRRVLVCR